MRVYLPATLPLLGRWHAVREVGPAPLAGHAVTAALRESYASGDEEELEYAAMTDAARASLRMLAADPASEPRRVVIVVDVADAACTPVAGDGVRSRSRVQVSQLASWQQVAAVHVDDVAAVETVREAVAALPLADAGDADAAFTLDDAEACELQWWATQEVPTVLAGRQ